MTIEEKLNDIEKGFKEFSEKMAKEKKYIVKNCPAKVDVYCFYSWDNGRNYQATCQNCNNCLIKKIIQTTNDKNVLDLFEIEVKNG